MFQQMNTTNENTKNVLMIIVYHYRNRLNMTTKGVYKVRLCPGHKFHSLLIFTISYNLEFLGIPRNSQ